MYSKNNLRSNHNSCRLGSNNGAGRGKKVAGTPAIIRRVFGEASERPTEATVRRVVRGKTEVRGGVRPPAE